MKKKTVYFSPLTEIFEVNIENLCGVRLSDVEGKSEYDDISTIGGNDDDDVAPAVNNIWFDEDED